MIRKLFFVVVASFLAFAKSAWAGDILTSDSCFAHIDSNLYVVNERMPRFVEEVYVGEICPAGYDVQLCYPEFQPVSGKELRSIRELQKKGVIPSDEVLDATGVILMPSPAPTGGLDLEKTLVIERKKGFLDISFCPVVRHEGIWKRILSCQVKVTALDSEPNAPHKAPGATERWAENSVLANGKWAKICVAKEGIYQLTAADIQKMGFSDLSKVKVYGYGGLLQTETFAFPDVDETVEQTTPPDDLVEVPVLATADGRILFWAEGTIRLTWNGSTKKYTHEQNCYSTASYYFVTENDDPRATVETLPEIEITNPKVISDVPFVAILDNDEFSWYEGGRKMFDGYDFLNGVNHTYRLDTPGFNIQASGTKSVDVNMGASSLVSATNFAFTCNNKSLGNCSVPTFRADSEDANCQSGSFTTNVSALSPTETNVFQVTASAQNKGRLDYIRVNYPRHLQLSSSPYSFCPQVLGTVSLRIDDANNTTHLWRIGQQGSPTAEIPTHLDGSVLEGVVPSGKRRFVFFDESLTYAAPTFVKVIENQNLHADSNVDYVIIVPANGKLVAQAERLGEVHKQLEGMTYRVVRADQLYNEFSSGTPDANAYRRYLKMLYDRAGSDEDAMPRYCLFMGKSLWDNRFVTAEHKGKSQDDYLLCYEQDDSQHPQSVGTVWCYVSDDFFGMLDDGEGAQLKSERLDIALGRMVCFTEEEAKLLVDKTIRYINNEDTGSWKNTLAFLGDDGDSNGHMKDSERVINTINTYAPNFDIQRVYWDRYYWTASATGYTYPQGTARIRQIMTEGALVFNYSGHGSPNIISHYKLLQTPDFATALSPHLSVWVLASCEIYPFDNGKNNLAETSLYVPDGGSVAFICATRGVYGQYNNPFNCEYTRFLFQKNERGEYNTLGESMRLAKSAILDTGGDGTINKLKYVCFGDPALKLAFPKGKVVLDSINGKAIDQMSGLEVLSAGSAARFSGHICLEGSDEIDETFNGSVSATVYDIEEEVVCKNNQVVNHVVDKTWDPFVYTERSKSIFKGTTSATAGRFEITAVIPRDISYSNKPGRISLYANKSDNSMEYSGYSESFCLNGTSEMAEPDVKGPEVIAYINSIDNPDYTITDENPVLIADISDDYGINNAGISLGHDIELVLDGRNNDPINLNSYFNYDFGSYQKGQLVYHMNGLERGQHTAQLRVWDVNNNVTITDVHFIVRSEAVEGGKDGYVTSTRNPATTETKFITYFPADVTVEGLVNYEVYDTRGRCVYKQPVPVNAGATSSSLSWDLCGNDHEPLPAGIYFYRTVVNTSAGSKATDAQKLIITRQ